LRVIKKKKDLARVDGAELRLEVCDGRGEAHSVDERDAQRHVLNAPARVFHHAQQALVGFSV